MRLWVRRVTSWLLAGLLVVLCLVLVATVAYPRAKGYVGLTVLSGSMEPSLPVGSQVFVEPIEGVEEAEAEISIGSVITYMPYPEDPTLVTHRVVEVAHDTKGEPVYTTRGDANGAVDEGRIGLRQLRGVVRYHVPVVGHVASSMTAERKGQVATALAIGLFGYAGWNVAAALRDRRRTARRGDAD